MAVLETLRVKFGVVITALVALGLLSFIIDPASIENAWHSMSSKYDVGEINGKAISYSDFQVEVDKFTKINEIITGSSVQNEQQQEQIRNAAWQNLIDRYLFIENAHNAGINVGKDELVALTTGDMISPVLSSDMAFRGEDGMFSKDLLIKFVQSVNSDKSGNLKTYWDYLQNTVYTQQFYAKYGSLFSKSNFRSPLMQNRAIAENNNTVNAEFVMVPLTYATDSTVQVSKSEIKAFYKKHKDFFKQKTNRDVEYVVFEVKPSDNDVEKTNNLMADLYNEFATTKNMKSFLAKNSDKPLTDNWYKPGDLNILSSELNKSVFSGVKTTPVFKNNNTFYAGRVMDEALVPDSVYVKHILLLGDRANKQADSLLTVLKKGAKFSNIAALYSVDKNSADGGQTGNIGWMTQSYMVPGFESVLTAKLKTPFILKTQFGTHIVEVEKRTELIKKKKVAVFEKEAIASKETINEVYGRANRFATLATGKYDNYKKAVDSLKVYSHSVNVMEGTSSYGAVENAKEITRWVFDNKKGNVSNIITVNNNYFFIATIKDVHKGGYSALEEVSEPIRRQLYAEKYSQKKAEEVAEQIAGLKDLNAIAEKLGTTVSRQSNIAFASMNSQGLDLKFIGAASVAPLNEICGPVAGNIGVYVFKVTGRDTGAFYTEDDAAGYFNRMNAYNARMILPVMQNDADVEDNRARFY